MIPLLKYNSNKFNVCFGGKMDAYECLLTRRSIRSFTDKKVSDDLVQKILTAGMYAPSARNERPWHFIVIRDRNTFEKL